ncbi:protein NRT1/ PTR FAMILY 5.4-like isoform X2 [Tasmannia lanceolata]|uniref:protein NRT1/ PTR FAMILY 5.4-like isoform X2 n=1 Tax=Tasmannia lanceolata TaxID=3420 RepID=UPI00406418E8
MCKGHILNALLNILYDIYAAKFVDGTTRQLWEDLDNKYKSEDAGHKKFRGLLTVTLTTESSKLLFFISLYLVAIGQGGHKPCAQAFGADQFDEENVKEVEAKKSFFNWWYLGTCIGGSSGLLIVTYTQHNIGWMVGFALPTIAMSFALVTFLSKRKSYVKQASGGSPFTRIAQVLVAAARKWRLSCTTPVEDEERVPLSRTNQFKFLDKAAIKDEVDEQRENKWRLCSTAQVEEVKLLIRLIPIWLTTIMYAVADGQIATFFTKQISTVNTNLTPTIKIPPASIQVIVPFISILIIPFYDRIFVPAARKLTGIPTGITTLQRIGVGIFLSVVSMVLAALVETKRLKIASQLGPEDAPMIPMSMWWLVPQFAIFGVADMLSLAGLQELFYDQMPDGMRSMGSAAFLSILSMGNFANNFIIFFIEMFRPEWLAGDLNHSRLDNYYWVLAGLGALWLVFYLIVSKRFIYRKIHG